MRGQSSKRIAVTKKREQNPNTALQEHLVKNLGANNALVQEYEVGHKEKPIQCWMRDVPIPHWLLALLVSIAIVAFMAFAIFASVVTLKKETLDGPCKSSSDCRQDLGLMCNNYRCGCGYSHFWSESYSICERRRMVNRTCVNDSECDALANLQCLNVTLAGGSVQSQCQCKTGLSWIINICDTTRLESLTCEFDGNCDSSRYLYCVSNSASPQYHTCRCNSSMFWNGNTVSGTCEYKRTINQYCKPYYDSWCDSSDPVGQGLICANYTNPYGSEYGICQCPILQFYNGTPSLADGYCVAMRQFGGLCSTVSECDYRVNMVCTNSLCTCASGKNFDSSLSVDGSAGYCVDASGYRENCTAVLTCSTSQSLYCDYTFYGVSTVGICLCNDSWSYWDGLICSSKLTLGGECSNDTHCISAKGLFCSNYNSTQNQCDCDKNHYWNETCILKQEYNTTCSSTYVCDDNRGLQCQGLGGSMFLKCDCYNTSYIWDSLYTNRNHKCIPKLSMNQTTCYGDLECEDYNYLSCVNGTCKCAYTDYWDGNRCQPKRNYTDPCTGSSTTYECRDFSPVNLICRLGDTVPPAYQCLCNTTSYWELCNQRCVVAKKRHELCTLPGGNCTSTECDVSANLQCMNDTHISSNSSAVGFGWCNCTSLQWWNGTYCRDKGTPAWGLNGSAICNDTYQCADYNLVSCPLSGSYPLPSSTCECATTKYWNGLTCLDRATVGQPCTSWPHYPVNTSTCLSAAGVGLTCSNATNCDPAGTNCTGGTCTCPSGTNWNTTFLICAQPPVTG